MISKINIEMRIFEHIVTYLFIGSISSDSVGLMTNKQRFGGI